MKSISSYFQKEKRLLNNNIEEDENITKKEKRIKLYEYYPREFLDICFNDIYDEVEKYLKDNSSRRTCVLCDPEIIDKIGHDYSTLNSAKWTQTIKNIKNYLESKFDKKIDYGLVQYYKNGNSSISWHNDKEAYNGFVFVVSFGAIRTFCIREMKTKKQVEKLPLISGDLIYMKDGFQKLYEHCIPIENKVHYERISLTFRQLEEGL